MKRAICALWLAAVAGPASAETSSGQFGVYALGLKVGDLALAGAVTSNRYTVSAQFVTSGLVATVAGVRFLLKASGARDGARFFPRAYSEDMDTGERESRVELRWSNGVARASGSEIGEPGPYAVTRDQQRGAVDPLTGIFMVMRDQRPEEVCTLRQKIFDGERLTEITLTNRQESGGTIRCSGVFRRLAGYSPEDLRKRSQFALTVTYAPAGELVQATLVEADTIYGKAQIRRK